MLYAAIFDSVAQVAPRLLLTLGDQESHGFIEHLSAKNIEIRHLEAPKLKRTYNFIYQAIDGHPDALGYQLIAEELFDYLADTAKIDLPILSFDQSPIIPSEFQEDYGNLSEVKKLSFCIGEEEVSTFTYVDPKRHQVYNWPGVIEQLSLVDNYAALNINSVVAIPFQHTYFFVPCDTFLHSYGNNHLTLSFVKNGRETTIPFVPIHPVTAFWGVVDSFPSELANIKLAVKKDSLYLDLSPFQDISHVQVKMGHSILLKGIREKEGTNLFKLRSTFKSTLYLRGPLDQKVDVHEIPPKGVVNLLVEYTSGKKKSIPFVEYSVKQMKL